MVKNGSCNDIPRLLTTKFNGFVVVIYFCLQERVKHCLETIRQEFQEKRMKNVPKFYSKCNSERFYYLFFNEIKRY